MGKNGRMARRLSHEKREEEKANRLFKIICFALLLLALLTVICYVLVL